MSEQLNELVAEYEAKETELESRLRFLNEHRFELEAKSVHQQVMLVSRFNSALRSLQREVEE